MIMKIEVAPVQVRVELSIPFRDIHNSNAESVFISLSLSSFYSL